MGGGRRLKAVETGLSGPKAFPSAFRAAEKKALDGMDSSDFVIIDEAGPLELKGKGHSRLLKKLLKNFDGTLVIAVRKGLAEAVLSKFAVKRAEVMKKLLPGEFFRRAGL